MRVQLILNPQADQGRGQQHADKIAALAQPYGGLQIVQPRSAAETRQQAWRAAHEGYDIVVAAGGDGTVHEVVNGLAQARVEGIDVALGVIPIGSGNDFAYANGLLVDVPTAVARIFTGQPRLIDLARIEDDKGRSKLFDNNFGLGLDAVVVIETQKIKRVRGFLMYLVAVLRTIALYYDRPRVTLQFDDEEVTQQILFVTVGIGPRGGGGFLLVPEAKNDDGLLDSCTVDPISRLRMLQLMPKTFNGSHVSANCLTIRKSHRLVIHSQTPMPIHIDGEVYAYPQDKVHHVTLTSLAGAMKVIV